MSFTTSDTDLFKLQLRLRIGHVPVLIAFNRNMSSMIMREASNDDMRCMEGALVRYVRATIKDGNILVLSAEDEHTWEDCHGTTYQVDQSGRTS